MPKITTHKAADGTVTYRFRVMVTGPDGKRHPVRGTGFRTKTEANRALAAELTRRATDTSQMPSTDTVGRWLVDWLEGLDPTIAANAQYRRLLGTHVVERTMTTRFKSFTPDFIAKMYRQIAASRVRRTVDPNGVDVTKPLGGWTMFGLDKALHVAMNDAVARHLVTVNPVDGVRNRPGAPKRATTTWTEAEAAAFIATYADHPFYAAWVLMLTRGLRRGEVAGLVDGDIDYDANRICLDRAWVTLDGDQPRLSEGKNSWSHRVIELDPFVAGVLVDHAVKRMEWATAAGTEWTDTTGWLFVWPTAQGGRHGAGDHVNPRIITEQFQAACRQLGLRPIRLYDLRHTAATHMISNGTPIKVVSEMLGHSRYGTTADVYFNVTPAMHAEAGAAHTARLLDAVATHRSRRSQTAATDATGTPADA